MRTNRDLIEELEQLGEAAVKRKLQNGDYGHPQTGNPAYECVEAWLSSNEAERAEARAKENLSISRKALRNSRWATAIAIIAMLLSIVMAWFQRK
jgi:hypothetical protein